MTPPTAQSVEKIIKNLENSYNTRVFAIFKMASFLSTRLKQKSTAKAVLFCLERCVPQAERDAHDLRDVCFASDVRFAREQGTHHITATNGSNITMAKP